VRVLPCARHPRAAQPRGDRAPDRVGGLVQL